ncbi:putative 40S ribosomal protein S18 [Trypanosoma grayi]|uniref:putative 40S ribosomal protein S18 n=1 Tax=Trypanosoma grayi TaxID=71804 RepID=UPI0004F420A2|nr:putative 40S ribosomal protein S18 [Trypanosoma grayi]KEG11835.1 putative 40S ribosomal protein S18 [Trypanosoma grayi]
MSLTLQPDYFQHIVRLLNTNVEGKRKVPFALRMVKGIGIRFAYMVCKKAGVDVERRAGTLTAEELEKISDIITDPAKFKIPDWFLNRQRDPKTGKTEHLTSSMVDTRLREDLERLNRQRDPKTGKTEHLTSSMVDTRLREDLERLRKIRAHRGVRHAYGLRVRGQHTCTSGRHGKTVGVSRTK